MRIFLDTNVLASALGTRGLCADLLRRVITSEELIVTDPLLLELRRILAAKFALPDHISNELIEFLVRDSIRGVTGELHTIHIVDKDDIVILASALNSQVDMFVTGDKEILALKSIDAMKIASPREYWDLLIESEGF